MPNLLQTNFLKFREGDSDTYTDALIISTDIGDSRDTVIQNIEAKGREVLERINDSSIINAIRGLGVKAIAEDGQIFENTVPKWDGGQNINTQYSQYFITTGWYTGYSDINAYGRGVEDGFSVLVYDFPVSANDTVISEVPAVVIKQYDHDDAGAGFYTYTTYSIEKGDADGSVFKIVPIPEKAVSILLGSKNRKAIENARIITSLEKLEERVTQLEVWKRSVSIQIANGDLNGKDGSDTTIAEEYADRIAALEISQEEQDQQIKILKNADTFESQARLSLTTDVDRIRNDIAGRVNSLLNQLMSSDINLTNRVSQAENKANTAYSLANGLQSGVANLGSQIGTIKNSDLPAIEQSIEEHYDNAIEQINLVSSSVTGLEADILNIQGFYDDSRTKIEQLQNDVETLQNEPALPDNALKVVLGKYEEITVGGSQKYTKQFIVTTVTPDTTNYIYDQDGNVTGVYKTKGSTTTAAVPLEINTMYVDTTEFKIYMYIDSDLVEVSPSGGSSSSDEMAKLDTIISGLRELKSILESNTEATNILDQMILDLSELG